MKKLKSLWYVLQLHAAGYTTKTRSGCIEADATPEEVHRVLSRACDEIHGTIQVSPTWIMPR